MRTFLLAGLFVLAMLYTLHFAKAFFLPVAIAVLLNLLFSPVVRWLRDKLHVPAGLSAALILIALLGLVSFTRRTGWQRRQRSGCRGVPRA